MKICMNIATVIWPTMSVAKATRHSRLNQGWVFSLGLSRSYRGQSPDTPEKLPPGMYRIEDGGLDANGDRLINVIYEVDDRATDSAGRAR